MTYYLSFMTKQHAQRAVVALCLKTDVCSISSEVLSASVHSLSKNEPTRLSTWSEQM